MREALGHQAWVLPFSKEPSHQKRSCLSACCPETLRQSPGSFFGQGRYSCWEPCWRSCCGEGMVLLTPGTQSPSRLLCYTSFPQETCFPPLWPGQSWIQELYLGPHSSWLPLNQTVALFTCCLPGHYHQLRAKICTFSLSALGSFLRV
jgi:hypothetical protein